MSQSYYRPIVTEAGRWPLAGGSLRFSLCEVLTRDSAAWITDDIPDQVLAKLTLPRAPLAGLPLDRPRVMGIVNATPDSFSDGGSYDPVQQGADLFAAGADIVDVGGESTRPGAQIVTVADELARVSIAIKALSQMGPVSVDTRKADVVAATVPLGAGIANDVSGLDYDPSMAATVAALRVPICLMHAQGTPQNMQDDPSYDNVVLDIYDALADRAHRALMAGVAGDQIVIDPGIGFGKTQAHNLSILRRISLFHGLGYPILLGASRKRFIGSVAQVENAVERGPGSLAVTLGAIAQGVQIHRVHDVAATRQAIMLWQAVATAGPTNSASEEV